MSERRPKRSTAVIVAGCLGLVVIVALAWWLGRPDAGTPPSTTEGLAIAEDSGTATPAVDATPPPAVFTPAAAATLDTMSSEATERDDPPGVTRARMLGRLIDVRGQPISGAVIVVQPSRAGRGALGLPLSYAVAAYDESALPSTRSAADGSFSLLARDVVPSAQTSRDASLAGLNAPILLARHNEHRLTTIHCPLWGGSDIDLGDVRMEQAVIIVGRVLAPDGAAIAGARISPSGLSNSSEHHGSHTWQLVRATLGATSDVDGRFSLHGWWPGKLSLEIEASGFARRLLEVKAGRPGRRHVGDVELQPTFTVTGTVSDSRGQPLAGIEVVARSAGSTPHLMGGDDALWLHQFVVTYNGLNEERRTTNAAGRFAISTQAEWPVDVIAAGAGREPARAQGVTWGSPALDLVMADPAMLILRAVDAETDAPLPGATGVASRVPGDDAQRFATLGGAKLDVLVGQEAVTLAGDTDDPIGLLVIRPVGTVATRVTVSAPGRSSLTVELPGQELGSRATKTFRLGPECQVRGRVVDGGGRPLAGVAVSMHPPSDAPASQTVAATTGGDGRYELAADVPGSWSLEAAHPRYAAALPMTITVVAGQDAQLDDTVLIAGSLLTGTLRHPDGRPATATPITATVASGKSKGLRATTDDKGQFQFRQITPGRWTLRAEPGAQLVTRLRSGGHTEVEMTLAAPCRVRGRVLGLAGPLAGATLQTVRDGQLDKRIAARSDASGLFELVVHGQHVELLARHEGRFSERVVVEIAGRSEIWVDVPFHTGRITGRVTLAATGAPAFGVRVRARQISDLTHRGQPPTTSPAPPAVVSDGEGAFAINDLAPGTWRLTTIKPWHARVITDVELPRHGQVHVELQLEATGAIQGTLRPSDGSGPQIDVRQDAGELLVWATSAEDPDERHSVAPRQEGERLTFHFERLRPGVWHLQVGERSASPLHLPADLALPTTVTARETTDVELRFALR